MKRMLFLAAFAAFATTALSAQKTDYRIDRLTDGAIYLVEISTPAPDSTGTIKPTEYPLKFQDDAALSAFIDQMRAIATKTRQAAEQKALVLDNAAERIALLLKPAQAPEKPKVKQGKNVVKKQ